MEASEWLYRKHFNENYNLSFGRYVVSVEDTFHFSPSHSLCHSLPYVSTCYRLPLFHCLSRPKSDTCKTCDSVKVRIEAETDQDVCTTLTGEWELHKRTVERCYQQLREDTALAQSDPNTDTVTFDLQQSLPTPVLTVNVVYYKRQLWTYNLGIHCCNTRVGHMHMWNESQASRGSLDILSCISVYLKNTGRMKEHRANAKHHIAYSDSCGGQNRNINFVCFWQHVASPDYSYDLWALLSAQ